MDDLAAFQGASGVQMADGVNFLSEQLAYCSLGGASATLIRRLAAESQREAELSELFLPEPMPLHA
jgi:hypothetical protein